MSDTFRALRAHKTEAGIETRLETLADADLMEADVTVRVEASTINFKDGLALTGRSPILRTFPMIPGIDFAGVVEASAHAGFAPGDRVRTRNLHPPGHTRLPRYARDKIGTVERVLGCHVFPDAAAAGHGEDPQWLYAVAFRAEDLWGGDGDPGVVVSIDAFEPYLEPA